MTHLGTGIHEVIKMLDVGGHHQPIIMFGHSAGAHIALHLSHHPKLANRVAGIAALSGIYETELVLELAVNEDVRLSKDEAHQWNCLTHHAKHLRINQTFNKHCSCGCVKSISFIFF